MEKEELRLIKNSDNDPLFSHSAFQGFYVDEVTFAREFLEGVTAQTKKALNADTGKGHQGV
jgi:hypothetical protein